MKNNVSCFTSHVLRIISVVGTRPNFIKIAPIIRAIDKHNESINFSRLTSNFSPLTSHLLIHTGQHYDYEMSRIFFEDLDIPEPDIYLGVTGKVMIEFEKVLLKEKPDLVIVVGDVNSTLAAALTAVKLHIPVAHVEAGLRSYDRGMPEEINRVLTDHISTFLFCPTETAVKNLQKEDFTNIVNNGKLINIDSRLTSHVLRFTFPVSPLTSHLSPLVINVGDVMYESALYNLEIAKRKSKILQTLNLTSKSYILATVHRAENTDYSERLKSIFDSFVELSKKGEKLIIPLHPRTKKALAQISTHSTNYLRNNGLKVIRPVSYLDMLILESNAKLIMTDSGGVQKESYFFKIPCVTLRDKTEWVETVESGWNVLVGADKEKILEVILDNPSRTTSHVSHSSSHVSRNIFGDGNAAEKIIKVLVTLEKAKA